MAVPGPVTRVLIVVGVVAGGVLVAVGGLALQAPGIVAVGVAGLLAGLTAAAVAHDVPGHTWRSTVEAGALAVAGTVCVLLLVSGTAALVGAVGTIAILATAAVGWLIVGWRRAASRARASRPSGADPATGVVPLTVVREPADGPVQSLSTAALGQEWLRTTAALAGRLTPAARRSIVDHREATLDELERRDPAGFGRWMAGGPVPGSDPAEYVRDGPVAGTEAA